MNNKTSKNEQIDIVNSILEAVDKISMEDALRLTAALKEKYQLDSLQIGEKQEESNVSVQLFLEDCGTLSRIDTMKVLNSVLGIGVSAAKEIIQQMPYCLLSDSTQKECQEKIDEFNAQKAGLIFIIR